MRSLKIYYAHPMSWYNTPEEEADVNALMAEGWEVIQPNSDPFRKRVENAKRTGFPVMDVFAQTIRDTADAVCFRRFKDGAIGAGVAREILEAMIWDRPVWEIYGVGITHRFPQIDFEDILTIEQTRERIAKGKL